MAYTLKIESGDDSREVEFLNKPSFADIDAVLRSISGQVAKYTDEEGDLCTLTESTFEDFLVTSQRSTKDKQNMLRLQLPALELGERPPSPSPSQCSSISASWTRIDDTGLEEPESLEAVEAIATSDSEDDNEMDQSLILQGVAEGATAAVELADDLTFADKQSDISAMPPPLHTVPEVPTSTADPWTSRFTNAFGGLVLTLGSKSAVQEPLSAPMTAEAADSDDSAASALAGEPNEAVEDSNFSRSSPRPALAEQSKVDHPSDVPQAVLSETEVTGELDADLTTVTNEEVAPSQGESQATPPGKQSDSSTVPPPLETISEVPTSKADPQFRNAFGGLVLTLGSKSATRSSLSAPKTADAAHSGDAAAPVLAVKPKEAMEISNFGKPSFQFAPVEQSEVDYPADVPQAVLSETKLIGELDAGCTNVAIEEMAPSQGGIQEDKSITLQGAAGGYTAAAELVDDLTPPGKQSDITARFPEVPAPKPDLRTSKFRNASGELVPTLGSKSALQQPLLDKNGGLAADFIDFAASSVGDEPRGTEEGRCANAAMVPVAPTPIKSEEPAAVAKVALHSTSEAMETSKKAFEISEDGAPDPLEANLPETALQFKVAPKAELAISCKVCCKSLELYLQAPFQRWRCDLCDRHLTGNDPMWACSTAQTCDWGMCSDCCYTLRTSYSQAKVQGTSDELSPSASQRVENELDALRAHSARVLEDVPPHMMKTVVHQMLDVLPPAEREKILDTIVPAAPYLVGEHAPGAAPRELQNKESSSLEKILEDADADPVVVKLAVHALLHQLTAADCASILRPLEEASSRLLTAGQPTGEEVDQSSPACNLAQAAMPVSGASESARATSTEKKACRCKNCSKQLELHMPGPFQRWICDLCDRHFEKQDPMWACSSAKACMSMPVRMLKMTRLPGRS